MLAMLGWFSEARTLASRSKRARVGISCKGLWEDLQGDLAAQLRVGGLSDLSHAPLPDASHYPFLALWTREHRFR